MSLLSDLRRLYSGNRAETFFFPQQNSSFSPTRTGGKGGRGGYPGSWRREPKKWLLR